MRIACIIMAHKEPGQVERLIKKFSHLPFDFYIHVDKKINARPFEYLATIPNVYFIQQRIRVRWASYSFLNAVIQSLKEASVSGIPYDFLTVMSGQDYPIKPVSQFYNSLAEKKRQKFYQLRTG